MAAHQSYSWMLIVLSYLISVLGSYTALQLAVGIHAHAAAARCIGGRCCLVLIGRWGRGVLCECGAGSADREQTAKSQC